MSEPCVQAQKLAEPLDEADDAGGAKDQPRFVDHEPEPPKYYLAESTEEYKYPHRQHWRTVTTGDGQAPYAQTVEHQTEDRRVFGQPEALPERKAAGMQSVRVPAVLSRPSRRPH